jgi:hypothetical protein
MMTHVFFVSFRYFLVRTRLFERPWHRALKAFSWGELVDDAIREFLGATENRVEPKRKPVK